MALHDELLREATEARDRFLERQRDLEHARADYHHAIRRLSAEGGSTREIAEALGLSHQRVHQIVGGEESAADRERRLVHLFAEGGSMREIAEALGLSHRRRRRFFDRFTEHARGIVVRAQEEAVALGHGYIGTEHLLLALTAPEGGVAGKALASLGVEHGAVLTEVVRRVGRGEGEPPAGRIPFTPKSKKVLEFALREARGLKHDYIGGEHVLLAIVRERENVACEILDALGADEEAVRRSVIGLLAA